MKTHGYWCGHTRLRGNTANEKTQSPEVVFDIDFECAICHCKSCQDFHIRMSWPTSVARLVGRHFVLKLIARNENIMESNRSWKKRIAEQLGATLHQRARCTLEHYKNVSDVLGWKFSGGNSRFPFEVLVFKLPCRLTAQMSETILRSTAG